MLKRRTMKTFILALFTIAIVQSPVEAQYRDGGAKVSFGVFYSSLGHYGEWISIGSSAYAWRPVGTERDWQPYRAGHWGWTDDGWYWVSDEPWGWATYHYGRWYYDDYYGWMWVPGYDWAPAWVEWRYGNDCVGWAPLSPYAVFSINFGIYYRTRWITPYSYWCFVDWHYINSPSVGRYVYRSDNNRRLIGGTRGAGSVRYNGGRIVSRGPERGVAERRGNIRLQTSELVDVHEESARGVIRSDGRERIEVYRPAIDERSVGDQRPEKVREDGRAVPLDMRYTTIRSKELDQRSGRDMRRAEQYRTRIERESTFQNERRGTEKPAATMPQETRTRRQDVERAPQQRQDQPQVSSPQRAPAREQATERRAAEPQQRSRPPERSEPKREQVRSSQRQEPQKAAPPTRQPRSGGQEPGRRRN